MFKLITLSCLLAVCVQCKNIPNPAVPYYPQPYPAVYPQVYSAQPKYNVQPAYVAAAPFAPANYRQVFVAPANPAYNPYYYGYAPYPAYPQQFPYTYAPNDGTQAPEAAAQPGWGEYLSNSFWNYVPNFPSLTSESQSTSEAESQGASAAESASTAEAGPVKVNKPAEVPKTEQKPSGDEQSSSLKVATPAPFTYVGQPQFYGQLPYQPAAYDPTKLNSANKGAVSSYLFYRNQPTIFQQPQPVMFADQKYYQIPGPQPYQGTAALAYQRYLQYQKQNQEGQYVPGQFQQDQFQQQQQDQPFQQQTQQFQQQPQQFQQQPQQFQQQPQQYQQQQDGQHSQQDDSSVVVDSNSPASQVDTEGQQEAQSKLATDPTIAMAQPLGIAFAGIGGRAGSGPIGTAIVGNNATAIAGPSATAVSMDLMPTIDLKPVDKLTTAYVAKYAPELGVYKVAEIKTWHQ